MSTTFIRSTSSKTFAAPRTAALGRVGELGGEDDYVI
jgi:hypothetical protein